jgi:hypothetical protein
MISSIGPAFSTAYTAQARCEKYAENLCAVQENKDGKFTQDQALGANKRQNDREYKAFGYLAGDASADGIVKFAQAYLDFYKRLSPEEQLSDRYRGTDISTGALLAEAKAQLAGGGDVSPTEGRDEIKNLMSVLFDEKITSNQRKVADESFGSIPLPSVTLTISADARLLLQSESQTC